MTRYIWALPQSVQLEILETLVLVGIGGDDLSRAMDGRLCDLEDTIEIGAWL